MISAQKSQKNVLKDLTSGNHSLGTKEVAHKKYAQPQDKTKQVKITLKGEFI